MRFLLINEILIKMIFNTNVDSLAIKKEIQILKWVLNFEYYIIGTIVEA